MSVIGISPCSPGRRRFEADVRHDLVDEPLQLVTGVETKGDVLDAVLADDVRRRGSDDAEVLVVPAVNG
jgi:hypothetical protein